jgi:peroxiredoxin Q/BCP
MNRLSHTALLVITASLLAAPARALEVGDACPELSGLDQSTRQRGLAEYLGRKFIVVTFYPKDFTPLSMAMAKQFARSYGEFARHNAIVFAVSNEHPRMHAAFADRFQLPCPVIADVDDAWRRAFGAETQTETLCTYIIDLKGKIAKVYADVTDGTSHVKTMTSDLLDVGAKNFGFKEGDFAPDITLPRLGQEKPEPFQVKSLRGQAVALWFTCGPPGFTCSQCRTLMTELEQRYAEFQALGAEVVVIAREGPVPGSLLSTIKLDNLEPSFPVLMDDDQEAAWSFGAVTAGRSRTTMAVLDKNGVVQGLRRIVSYRHPSLENALELLGKMPPSARGQSGQH